MTAVPIHVAACSISSRRASFVTRQGKRLTAFQDAVGYKGGVRRVNKFTKLCDDDLSRP